MAAPVPDEYKFDDGTSKPIRDKLNMLDYEDLRKILIDMRVKNFKGVLIDEMIEANSLRDAILGAPDDRKAEADDRVNKLLMGKALGKFERIETGQPKKRRLEQQLKAYEAATYSATHAIQMKIDRLKSDLREARDQLKGVEKQRDENAKNTLILINALKNPRNMTLEDQNRVQKLADASDRVMGRLITDVDTLKAENEEYLNGLLACREGVIGIRKFVENISIEVDDDL